MFSGGDAEWRRLIFLIIGLIFLILATGSKVVGGESPSMWRSDFKAALQEAEEKKLPLLVHFYADWCMPCQRMEREVFPTQAVKDLLGSRFVAVKVNSDHHQDLVKRYGVETLPSDVMVDSLTGRVIALHSGFQDRTGYLANASQAEARFVKAHASDLIVAKSTPTEDRAQQASGVKIDHIELGEPRLVIGLDGYSPISLTKSRQWNRGSPKFAWDYKDVTYYLSTREELVEFRNNPEVYAPKLLGCDPVILWESDKAVAGDIRFGAFFDGELFLFKSEDRRRQFKSNPDKYIRLQHALKADQIERTVLR
jgi:YHS domain-containing protein/thioredoxin-related protein